VNIYLHPLSRLPIVTSFLRSDVEARTKFVPGQAQASYHTWQAAHNAYAAEYAKGLVQIVILKGGPFDIEELEEQLSSLLVSSVPIA
jgi:hypothetical protein